MSANRRRDTGSEVRLRSALHRRRWRFRVDLPVEVGDRRVPPDVTFTRQRASVFVDGCFWHNCPEHGERPRANGSFWDEKFRRTVERDCADTESLECSGWTVIRIWEHELAADAVADVETVRRARRKSQRWLAFARSSSTTRWQLGRRYDVVNPAG